MNATETIKSTNTAERTLELGDNVLGIMTSAIHKQATAYSDQYKNILKNEISEYEKVISKLMSIIDFYEMECVPYGKIRRLSDKYESIVYRAVSNARRNIEESSFDAVEEYLKEL
jgi:hypothetical protein